MSRIRIAIVGVENCASSLVQGIAFYRDAASNEAIPGLMHVHLGGYHVGDVEVVAAFDIAAGKVGRLSWIASGATVWGVAEGQDYVDVGTLHGYRQAVHLLDERDLARPAPLRATWSAVQTRRRTPA